MALSRASRKKNGRPAPLITWNQWCCLVSHNETPPSVPQIICHKEVLSFHWFCSALDALKVINDNKWSLLQKSHSNQKAKVHCWLSSLTASQWCCPVCQNKAPPLYVYIPAYYHGLSVWLKFKKVSNWSCAASVRENCQCKWAVQVGRVHWKKIRGGSNTGLCLVCVLLSDKQMDTSGSCFHSSATDRPLCFNAFFRE